MEWPPLIWHITVHADAQEHGFKPSHCTRCMACKVQDCQLQMHVCLFLTAVAELTLWAATLGPVRGIVGCGLCCSMHCYLRGPLTVFRSCSAVVVTLWKGCALIDSMWAHNHPSKLCAQGSIFCGHVVRLTKVWYDCNFYFGMPRANCSASCSMSRTAKVLCWLIRFPAKALL